MASDIAELQFMAKKPKEERDDLQEINVEELLEEVTETSEEKAVVIEEPQTEPQRKWLK